jgi:hypothetical protein
MNALAEGTECVALGSSLLSPPRSSALLQAVLHGDLLVGCLWGGVDGRQVTIEWDLHSADCADDGTLTVTVGPAVAPTADASVRDVSVVQASCVCV